MYRFVESQQRDYPIELVCQTLKVSRSAWYAWRKGDTYQIKPNEQQLEEQVIAVFKEHRRRYGARRLVIELHSRGIEVGYHKIRGIMKKYGLKAIQRHRPSDTVVRASYH